MNNINENPYAAPSNLASLPEVPADTLFFRDGQFLVVRDGAVLPHVCVVTNQPATATDWRKKTRISCFPIWVFALILVNIIVLAIVALVMQKKATITYSLARSARDRIVRRRSAGWLLLILFGALSGYGLAYESGAAAIMAAVALVAGLVFLVISNPIKAMKYKKGWFRIRGCSRGFLDALPEFPSPF
jgi:hypothetical protein